MLTLTTSFAFYDPIYKETGQIQLDELELSSDNNIKVKSQTIKSTSQKESLINLCKANPEIERSLIKDINDDIVPQAIGYTTYCLKEVKDNDGMIHYEPMTVNEVKGQTTITRYNLTLTLNVNTYVGGSTRYLGVHSYIYWAPAIDLAGERRVANGSDDFCSLSFPSVYRIYINNQTGGIEGHCTNPYLYDVNNYSAVAGFRENNGGTYMRASSTRSSSGSTASRRFTSKYVHTWKDAAPSISFSNTGEVTFGMTSSKEMWQIAAYVDFVC